MASYDPRDAEKLHELHQPAAPRKNFQRRADMMCKNWLTSVFFLADKKES